MENKQLILAIDTYLVNQTNFNNSLSKLQIKNSSHLNYYFNYYYRILSSMPKTNQFSPVKPTNTLKIKINT